jgi:DNA-binding NarL/FixJ family response regulator
MKNKSDILDICIFTKSHEILHRITEILMEKDHYRIVTKVSSLPEPSLLPGNSHVDFVLCYYQSIEMKLTSLVKQIKSFYTGCKILVIMDESPLGEIPSLYSAGVDGLLETRDIHKIHLAIHTIIEGKRYLNQQISNCLLQNMLVNGSATYDDQLAGFKLKEHQVFQLVSAGYGEEMIADILDINLEQVLFYKKQLNSRTTSCCKKV